MNKEKVIKLLHKYGNESEMFKAFVTEDEFENLAEDIVKLFAIPVVIVQSEQSNCVHSYEHILTVKTLKYKCKYCGDEKWEQLD